MNWPVIIPWVLFGISFIALVSVSLALDQEKWRLAELRHSFDETERLYASACEDRRHMRIEIDTVRNTLAKVESLYAATESQPKFEMKLKSVPSSHSGMFEHGEGA